LLAAQRTQAGTKSGNAFGHAANPNSADLCSHYKFTFTPITAPQIYSITTDFLG
jgi:hypothetical protein